MAMIELCCSTCEFAVKDDEKITCAYDGNQTTPDWFCRHWEEKDHEY